MNILAAEAEQLQMADHLRNIPLLCIKNVENVLGQTSSRACLHFTWLASIA